MILSSFPYPVPEYRTTQMLTGSAGYTLKKRSVSYLLNTLLDVFRVEDATSVAVRILIWRRHDISSRTLVKYVEGVLVVCKPDV